MSSRFNFCLATTYTGQIGQCLVEVYDLLHHKVGTQWVLSPSSYRKLRLDKNWLIKQISELGLTIVRDTFDGGMVSIVAKKIGSA